jgi:hypothetical protein
MEICKQPTLTGFEDESLCSAQVCPVSQQVLPGSAEAVAMTVGSGRQLSMLLDQSSPIGAFSKILLGSSLWTSSGEFCYVWNRLDTKFALSAFQLTPLGQSTEDNGYSLWRTPNANIVTGGGQDGRKRLEAGHAMQLSDQVLTPKLWPTTCAQEDGKSSGSLNPRFVEELMGFSIDHTALKPSATPSCRSKLTPCSRQSPISKGVHIRIDCERLL